MTDSAPGVPLTPDLAIIGSGSGNSLITPHWDGRPVVLADRGVGSTDAFGGTCLNVGCIPTKMFVRPAALAHSTEEAGRLGVDLHLRGADWPQIRDRIFARVDAISRAGRHYRAEELDHVTLLEQQVRLTGPRSFLAEDGTEVRAEQLVLAAGSRPVLPEVPGVDLPQVHTSDSVMRLESLPSRVLIVGGGYIACEFAGIFSGLGSEVIQVNRSVGLMSALDPDLASAYSAEAEKSWTVLYERTLGAVVARDPEGRGEPAGATAQLLTVDGRQEEYDVDIVLIAIGRRPNSDLLGAEEAGLDLHDDGRIVVDAWQRVLAGGEPVEGLYALGDLSSAAQLKHVANHEARVVAHNLENPHDLRPSRQHAVPAAVFSHPELAQVGLTEPQAVEQIGAEHVTVKIQHYGDTAYGWAMEDSTGIVKVIADRRDGTLLGGHAMGYQASNLLQPVIQAMSFGQDAHSAARGQYWIHPALMEVTENALLGLDVPPSRHL
ncbi:mycothione reductase [Nesterenkonia sp. PF2B19]|uniref:mycothione reductase n=1 Tax=unclassified Nesterenkonia TaxID=2629769 RepID=UPI0008721A81|nr:mycothione reductase [Nesterenkonia sp. PF2B19]OSM44491.1 mycothione reductase [Nesterenkonia sp. PF2B19]